jgi:uncharacterized protein YjiS (DUF1127 family)
MSQFRHFSDVVTSRPALPQIALSRLFRQLVGGLVTWQDRAQQRLALAELTDRDLQDIGLSRDDIERETAKPLWRP